MHRVVYKISLNYDAYIWETIRILSVWKKTGLMFNRIRFIVKIISRNSMVSGFYKDFHKFPVSSQPVMLHTSNRLYTSCQTFSAASSHTNGRSDRFCLRKWPHPSNVLCHFQICTAAAALQHYLQFEKSQQMFLYFILVILNSTANIPAIYLDSVQRTVSP